MYVTVSVFVLYVYLETSDSAVRSLTPRVFVCAGTEFVRPVVGYFCNLCQLIYADEDEAKLQHCSSLVHYRKYQVTSLHSQYCTTVIQYAVKLG